MKNSIPIGVFIIDDHEVVSQSISYYLKLIDGIHVVGEANNGEDGIEKIKILKPDIILVDLVMPDGIDGFETTKRVKAISPLSNIIILTSCHQNKYLFQAIKSGASSYLLKSTSAQSLVDAIFATHSGEIIIPELTSKEMVSEIKSERSGQIDVLTKREIEILEQISNGHDNALIAEELFISIKTVRTHVSSIISKLNVNNRTQAAIYALKNDLFS